MTDYERIKREYDLSLLQKNRLMDKVWPVGSIYMSLDATDPAVRFGGVWERIENAFLLAASKDHPAGESGGEETHTLTVDEMPRHTHPILQNMQSGSNGMDSPTYIGVADGSAFGFRFGTSRTESTGGGQPHNNMPPYLAVYIWTRIR